VTIWKKPVSVEELTRIHHGTAVRQLGIEFLAVGDDTIIERMSGRRCHVASGRTYHVKFNPPKKDMVDDVTGEALVLRKDDEEATVRNRLDVYHRQTEPLVDYYAKWAATGDKRAPKYHRIDGLGKVEEVRDRIFAALG